MRYGLCIPEHGAMMFDRLPWWKARHYARPPSQG
jgi:hypothetical protein